MRQRLQAAIFFTAEDFHMTQKELKGRQAAGSFFLRGLVNHTAFPEVVLASYLANPGAAWRKTMGPEATVKPVQWIHAGNNKAISRVGCLYFSAPNFERFAYMRLGGHPRDFSICGVTHTTASCLNLFSALPALPLFSWDALICTSRAVRDTLRVVLEDSIAYYAWRFGSGRTPLPQLPLIPLGVLADEYVTTDMERITARTALDLKPETVVFIFVGRLSFHGKANPAQMFMALEEVARDAGHEIALVLCGWFGDKYQEDAFFTGAKVLSPSVRLIVLDGRDENTRRQAWAASDIFCSLSDNIQETFGLTPLEGMAAGLPVIVSDWDGYRDTVRHGIDGFRIRTIMPAPPLGKDLALRFASGAINYDRYMGLASQVTAVDLDACIKAMKALVESPELRRKMGEAGRQRARDEFEWRRIIPQYEELWGELAERRRADAEPAVLHAPKHMPEYPDPFRAFGSYPSEQLTGKHNIQLRVDNPVEMLEQLSQLDLFQQGGTLGLNRAALQQVLDNLQKNGATKVEDFSRGLRPEIYERLVHLVLWCTKVGIVKVIRNGGTNDV